MLGITFCLANYFSKMASKADKETEDSFCAKINKTVVSGYVLAGLSMGTKLRLFEALSSCSNPVTSGELADKRDLKERYVREWLHHMVMCDVVDVDETGTKFSIPQHRLKALTDPSQLLSFLGSPFSFLLMPHKEILDCFRQDGPMGVPYETVMPWFEERCCWNADQLRKCAEYMSNATPDIKDNIGKGVNVLEVGCGSGTMLLHMASQFPKSNFYGVELSDKLMSLAKKALTEQKLTNVNLYLRDATTMPDEWSDYFDIVFIRDVLHDIAHVSKALRSIYKCIKPGGILSVMEVNLNSNPFKSKQNIRQKQVGRLAYIISTYHCLPASMNTPGSAGLGAGSGIETITKLLEEAGFLVDVPLAPDPADTLNVNIICKKI